MKNSKNSKKRSSSCEENSDDRPTPTSRAVKKKKHYQKRECDAQKTTVPTLEEILAEHNVGDMWDFCIFGDGSGSSWDSEIGWGSVSIERRTGERKIWTGSMNNGTVNVAEIMAYVQPLNWILAKEIDRRHKGHERYRALRVHIFTDSQYCRDSGRSGRVAGKNSPLWKAFEAFRHQGIVLTWHWIRRDSVALNTLCDGLSKHSRLSAVHYNKKKPGALSGNTAAVYDINSTEG